MTSVATYRTDWFRPSEALVKAVRDDLREEAREEAEWLLADDAARRAVDRLLHDDEVLSEAITADVESLLNSLVLSAHNASGGVIVLAEHGIPGARLESELLLHINVPPDQVAEVARQLCADVAAGLKRLGDHRSLQMPTGQILYRDCKLLAQAHPVAASKPLRGG